MKNLKYFTLLLVIVTIFSSCKKDDVEDTDNTVDPVIPFTIKIDNEEVVEGTTLVKTYTVVGEDGQLSFNITNKLDESINLKSTVVSIVGDGTDMQLCFETCSSNIVAGTTEIKTINSGVTTTNAATHIYNAQVGNRNFECTVKINQVDDNDVDIVDGKELMFTYKYVAP